ncbi:hypothetical protein TWF730_004907 [Orbilia blumenaviensis]|uniref:F-box domain-containing protein n=1 Tax=Orbilia blumenaviensis TaxID=1796055 RepID=A0AAV9VHU4_9PEZI
MATTNVDIVTKTFNTSELLEQILIFHASRDNESRKHTLIVCRLVKKSWNKLISESPAIRSLTWEYSLYFPGRTVNDYTPFAALERYFRDKWVMLQEHIDNLRYPVEDFVPDYTAKDLIGRYFRSCSPGEENATSIFLPDSKIEFLRVTVYGYQPDTMFLWRGKLRGKGNINIGGIEQIVHDALSVQHYDIHAAVPRLCIQLLWRPPLPIRSRLQRSSQSPPKSFSIRAIIVERIKRRFH